MAPSVRKSDHLLSELSTSWDDPTVGYRKHDSELSTEVAKQQRLIATESSWETFLEMVSERLFQGRLDLGIVGPTIRRLDLRQPSAETFRGTF
jgi:hypothetical protein